jgi:hypothetical protein
VVQASSSQLASPEIKDAATSTIDLPPNGIYLGVFRRKQILDGLEKTPEVDKEEWVTNGFEAAKKTIEMMRNTFKAIAPADLVQVYIDVGAGGKASSDALWKAFGAETIKVMQGGAHLLAVLWESAWNQGSGEDTVGTTKALTDKEAMAIVADEDFCPSMSVDAIGSILKSPTDPSPAGKATARGKRANTSSARAHRKK